jgi:hypothetical protein
VERFVQFAIVRPAGTRRHQATTDEHPSTDSSRPGVSDSVHDESPTRPRPLTAGMYTGPVKVHSDEIEDYLKEHWKPE